MSLPDKTSNLGQEEFAESFRSPGMYLIALRAHLQKGRTMLGNLLQGIKAEPDASASPADETLSSTSTSN